MCDSLVKTTALTSTNAAPIGRLPDDIVHEVMLLVMLEQCCLNSSAIDPWLDISQVCRYWRRLALASPQLWRHLDIRTRSSPALVREMLKRSRGLTLCVHLWGLVECADTTGVLPIVALETFRIEEFAASGYTDVEMKETILPTFAFQAPALRRLSIITSGASIGDMIFNSKMSSLNEVRLEGIALLSCHYHKLTNIILHDHPALFISHPSKMLRASPDLKMFVLSFDSLFDSTDDDDPSIAQSTAPIEMSKGPGEEWHAKLWWCRWLKWIQINDLNITRPFWFLEDDRTNPLHDLYRALTGRDYVPHLVEQLRQRELVDIIFVRSLNEAGEIVDERIDLGSEPAVAPQHREDDQPKTQRSREKEG
ncbi:hypothetical protein CERSUDRAFT_93156 [Gelatoporia subvermispora B]|uniref:F-box domain-containing protein n=1 Tax=Ceriporiopsis subvermispora (strain B) TaxID=914234 RepID=M2PRA0_CERS8|nr:hypothetical protein CERSUDRAFT_93156 [Gelatoporia subvermispora B]